MPLKIHLQNYQVLPNLKRLREAEYPEGTYFSLGFQIAFQTQNENLENTQNNLIFLALMLVEQYEKKLSILFDKCDYIIQHNTNYQDDFSTIEIQFKDTDGFDDDIELKAIPTNTNPYNYKNLHDALEGYIINDIKIHINNVENYLDDNDIDYHPQELKSLLNKFRNKINESFSEEYLKNCIPKEVSNANSLLMYQDLNKKIPIKSHQLTQKLKI